MSAPRFGKPAAVFLVVLGFMVMTSAVGAEAAYSWGSTCREYTVTNPSGSDQTNYPVYINVTKTASVTSDLGIDVRFFNTPCSFIDNNASAVFLPGYFNDTTASGSWIMFAVNVPKLPAGGMTVSAAYGNESATYAASGVKTFVLFDDCNDGSFNTTMWTVGSGSVTEENGYCKLINSGTVVRVRSANGGFGNAGGFVAYRNGTASKQFNGAGFGDIAATLNNMVLTRFTGTAGQLAHTVFNSGGTDTNNNIGSVDEFAGTTLFRFETVRNASNSDSSTFINWVFKARDSSTSISGNERPVQVFADSSSSQIWVDYMYYRNRTQTEPTVTAGLEQISGGNITVFNMFNRGNSSLLNGFTVYVTNGTAFYQAVGTSSGFNITNTGLPLGSVNATFSRNGFENSTVNSTISLLANGTINASAWRLQQFRAADNSTSSTISSFTVTASNSTSSWSGTTSNGTIVTGLSNIPIGSNMTIQVAAPGYSTNTSYWAVTGSTEFNTTFFLQQSNFVINNVFDELTLAPICYNGSISNTSTVYTFSACGTSTFATNLSYIPTGYSRVTISNSSYVQRDYWVTISQSGYVSLTAYLIPTGWGNQITTFVYSDSTPQGIYNALTTAYKNINGTWIAVEQKTTDTQGKGYFYLYPFTEYRVRATYQSSTTLIQSYYPNPSFILYIKLSDSAAASNLTWVFDTVAVAYSPISYYVSGIVPISYTVTSTTGDLTYFGLLINTIYPNGTTVNTYSTNTSGSPSGGSINVNLNTTGVNATRWDVVINFKRSGYDEWNATYKYFPQFFTGFPNFPTNVLNDTIRGIQPGGDFGFTGSATMQWIVLILALVAGAAVGRFNQEGGAIVFACVCALFAVFGMFEWGWVVLIVLAAVGITAARRYL